MANRSQFDNRRHATAKTTLNKPLAGGIIYVTTDASTPRFHFVSIHSG